MRGRLRRCDVLQLEMSGKQPPGVFFSAGERAIDACEADRLLGVDAAWSRDGRAAGQAGRAAGRAAGQARLSAGGENRSCPVVALGGKCQPMRDILGRIHPAQTASDSDAANADFAPAAVDKLARLLASQVGT